MANEKKRKKKKRRWVDFLLVLILLVGVAVVAYPSFSDYWNSFHQSRAIMTYMESVSKIDTSQYDVIMDSARVYNAVLNTGEFRWFLTD